MRWYFLKLFAISEEDFEDRKELEEESSVILGSLKKSEERASIGEGKNGKDTILKNTHILHNLEENGTPTSPEVGTPLKPVAKSNTKLPKTKFLSLSNSKAGEGSLKNVCDSCGRLYIMRSKLI